MRYSNLAHASILFTAATALFAQQPVVSAGGVVNAASFVNGQPVAPGSVVAIFGSNLAANVALADTVPWATKLGNTSVTFNGILAPLQVVQPGQINAQIPWEVLPTGAGTANIVVTNNGVDSAPQPVVMNPIAPGIFQFNGHAIAINITDPNSDRYLSFAAPLNSITGVKTFPAVFNDFLFIYATGLGPVTPAPVTGHDSLDATRAVVTNPVAFVNNTPARVLFAGLSPQYPGIYQVNIQVPQVPGGSALPLQFQSGGFTSPATTTIAVQ